MTGGNTSTIDVLLQSDTVYSLMEKIQQKEYFPTNQQRLIFGGKQLCKTCYLYECGISKNSTIYMLLRIQGGGGVFSMYDTQQDFPEIQIPQTLDTKISFMREKEYVLFLFFLCPEINQLIYFLCLDLMWKKKKL